MGLEISASLQDLVVLTVWTESNPAAENGDRHRHQELEAKLRR